MAAELILWGRTPDGAWLPITRGSNAHCRRERAVRTPSAYWRDLTVLPVGTPVPDEWQNLPVMAEARRECGQ